MRLDMDDVTDRLSHGLDTLRDRTADSDLPGRIGHSVDKLRDRTADAVSADGESVLAEVSRLGDRLDMAEERLADRIDGAHRRDRERLDELLAASRATTWPRRLFWLLAGIGLGAAAAYLADPDRGHARRTQLADQAAARAREVRSDVAGEAKTAVDRAQGTVIERAKGALPEDVPDDPKTLEARIHSQVFGFRDDVEDVVLRVDAPGTVALKGTLPRDADEQALIAAVNGVEGVVEVTSELSVRSS